MFIKSLCLLLILSVSLANVHEIEAYFRHTNHFLSPKEPSGIANIQDRNTLINQLEQGVVKLMSYFSPSTGVWNDPNCVRQGSCVNGTGWWYWGNALHVLADYQKYASGRSDYSSYFDGIFSKNLNEMTSAGYFDDEGWWGLALLHLYKTTNNQTFFDQAKNIANDMKNRGQQTACKGSGGIFWDAAKTQVGAIANELLLSLSARLALLNDTNGEYKNIALGVWNWIQGSGLVVNNNSLIDHYNVINQNTCGDLVNWSFTYTNGVVLSGLVDLYKLTGDTSYLDMANNIAYAAIERFAPKGIINDDYSNNDPASLAEDAFLFKGIFADNLAYLALNTKDSTLKTKITTLLNNNYSLLIFNQGVGGVYGYLWENKTGTNNPADIVTHISALYLIDSVLQLTS